ncbi:MAG: antitoxin VapB family protein [Opitutaceae bacterium]
MATKTITIKESAYRALARCKLPNESFSDTIEREFGQKITTTDELLALVRARRSAGRGLGLAQKKSRKTRAA